MITMLLTGALISVAMACLLVFHMGTTSRYFWLSLAFAAASLLSTIPYSY